MLCASLGASGVWGREMDTCICVAEPLCCSAEIITLLIAYTPVQELKIFLKRIRKASDSSPATLEARRQRSHASTSCGKVTLSLVRLSIKWSTIQIFFKHARSQKFFLLKYPFTELLKLHAAKIRVKLEQRHNQIQEAET